MNKYLRNKKTLKTCHIYAMLSKSKKAKHLSFHTPGHKNPNWDITELSFSDNLSNPKGCIKQAEEDIANLLGAKRSFILTDGSTSGIFCMLYALKERGVKSVAIPLSSHKSVYNACSVLGISIHTFLMEKNELGIEQFPPISAIKSALDNAGALLLVSPNYYGKTADYTAIKSLCNEQGKPLLIDGAHGGHLRFNERLHPRKYADLFVDGVHKSLPSLTQGAVVSTTNEEFVTPLKKAVDIFRTTSPSYPIMASVEYAVKYPKNEKLEGLVRAFASENPLRIALHEDYTKLCVVFGKSAFDAEKYFEEKGIFAEFCDGNVIMFYLSPATTIRQFKKLVATLKKAFQAFPLQSVRRVPAPTVAELCDGKRETELVEINECEGRICANTCGLFPPCTPLVLRGEVVTREKIELLKNANNTFGLQENKMSVYKVEL